MKKMFFSVAVLGLLVGFATSFLITGKFQQIFATSVSEVTDIIEQTPLPLTEDAELISPVPSPVPTLKPAKPEELIIPSLDIEAPIEEVGLDSNERMAVPQQDENVAWYQYGALPGEVGNSVIAGHFDSRTGQPAVFYNLDKVKIGAEILIVDDRQQTHSFIVTTVSHFDDTTFPTADIFGSTGSKNLRLITCAGQFDQQVKNYEQRLVVFARLKDESTFL